ncbi:MAG: hypothetical protein K6G08_01995, partial [Prevotella sp.]|nr:hypothetical protein [Prevotella sp.]
YFTRRPHDMPQGHSSRHRFLYYFFSVYGNLSKNSSSIANGALPAESGCKDTTILQTAKGKNE